MHTRPFGNVPAPDSEPAALFVTALDTQAGAPDPQPIIADYEPEFAAAVEVLTAICEAPLYLCHAPGQALPVMESARIRPVAFSGGSEAGLPGVHINALCPIGFGGGEVWQIGYQDVIALGHLLLHAETWPRRIIGLGGDAVENPRLLEVVPGASIDEILDGRTLDGALQIISGSTLYGRSISQAEPFLQQGQRQITVNRADPAPKLQPGVLIPGDELEALAPPGIYPVPLMRALQLGDAERARELGALELVEEDVAPLSRACISNNDYSRLLRRVLDQLEVLQT